MNWNEFRQKCESVMAEKGIDPAGVIVRVEVGDSFYDEDVKPSGVGISVYDTGTYLVIEGGM